MCLICSELIKNNLTSAEARRNLSETHSELEKEHRHEILRLIWLKEDKEDKEYESIMDYGSD